MSDDLLDRARAATSAARTATASLGKTDAADVAKVIEERTNDETGETEFCVIGEEDGRNFGCYPTRDEAQERLDQLERFD